MSVEELEHAASRLSGTAFSRFYKWLEKFAADQWDRQIEADVTAGRFDAAENGWTRTSNPAAARRIEAFHSTGILAPFAGRDSRASR